MNEKQELLKTLKQHRESFVMTYDSGYHMDQLIKNLEEEIQEELDDDE